MAEIIVQDLWKQFRTGEQGANALRDVIGNLLRIIKSSGNGKDEKDNTFWALRDVNFEVKKGEAMGVIGPNGSGKSTLLKLLSGILRPNRGKITMTGRVGALIEVGAGFHPELTGRENVYVNGAVLGLSRKEIDAKFDSIVAFSELEKFIDTPVKRYSSGMFVRLGFAVAAHLDPDVMLIDEVLAVGDFSFQKRCLKKIGELKDRGVTILFVSHNLHLVKILCDKTLYLNKGHPRFLGNTNKAIRMYSEDFLEKTETFKNKSEENLDSETSEVQITGVLFFDGSDEQVKEITIGDPLTIRIEYKAESVIENVSFGIGFYTPDGFLHSAHSLYFDELMINSLFSKGSVDFRIASVGLEPNIYLLSISITDSMGLDNYAWHQRAYPIKINSGRSYSGMYYLPHEWTLNSESEESKIVDNKVKIDKLPQKENI